MQGWRSFVTIRKNGFCDSRQGTTRSHPTPCQPMSKEPALIGLEPSRRARCSAERSSCIRGRWLFCDATELVFQGFLPGAIR